MSKSANPDRVYAPDQLEIFARCRPLRAEVPPISCVGGYGCWVEEGPPALIPASGADGGSLVCSRCRGYPRTRRARPEDAL